MDETKPAITFGTPATSEAPAEERGPITFGEPFSAPKPQRPGVDWQDVGQSAATRGEKGMLGTVIGAPGSVMETVAKDIPEFLRNRYIGMKERLDLISPQEREAAQQAPLYPGQSPEQAKGNISPSNPLVPFLSELPTYRGVTKKAEEAFPALGYEAKTPAGKIAGEAAEFGAQGIAGGTRGLVGRVVTGAAGGAGGEYMAEKAKEQGKSELPARIAGTLGGALSTGALIHVGNAFARPGAVAQQKLMEHVYDDLMSGKSPMTVDQFNDAIRNNTPVTILDLAGPRTQEFLSKYAEYNNANINQVRKLNDFMKERLVEGNQRIQETVNQAYGRNIGNGLDAAGMQESMAQAGKLERDRIYGLLRSHPDASQIRLKGMDPYVGDPILKEAEAHAMEAARNPDWKIIPPKEKPAIPGTESRWEQTPQGLRETPGTPGTLDMSTPGNLAYYNQVKIGLDGIIAKAEAANDKNVLSRAKNIREKLVNQLDEAVPDIRDSSGKVIERGYKGTRDIASDTFAAASAPEAGYKFFGAQNSFKRNELENILSNYNPKQRELFSAGYASRLNEIAGQPNGVKALANKFTADRNFQERARIALGQERYDAIRGKVLSENLLRNAEEINFMGRPSSTLGVVSAEAGAGAATVAAADYLMKNFSPETIGKAAVAAVGSATLGAGMTLADRRMARELITLATQQTPEAAQKFSQLLNSSQSARSVFNKMNTALNTAQQEASKGYLAQQSKAEPQQRANGGRIGFATGGAISPEAHADRLVAAAERAHKDNQKATEPLLDAHDNTIARALEIANQNI